jgi:uncharacterized protein DUF6188
MNQLGWLVGRRFQSLSRREYDWVAVFDQDAKIVIECLWRLVRSDRIQVTSEDHGQQFGLPAPLDAAAEVNARIAEAAVEAVEVRQGLLDLTLHFSTGHTLQIVPNSSGYEAWNVSNGNKQFIAVGGGELALLDGDRRGEYED